MVQHAQPRRNDTTLDSDALSSAGIGESFRRDSAELSPVVSDFALSGPGEGVSRRGFLRAVSASLAGLALAGFEPSPETVARAAEPGTRLRMAPTIILHLLGGPPAKETFTPDPRSSPVEMRGPYSSIATRVPGVHFCELWPELARRNDRFALLRAVDCEIPEHMEAIRHMLNPTERNYMGAQLGRLRGVSDDRPAPQDLYVQARPYFSGFERYIAPRPLTIPWEREDYTSDRGQYRAPVSERMEGAERRGQLLERLQASGRGPDTAETRTMNAYQRFAIQLSNGNAGLFSAPFQHTRAELDRYGDNELGKALLMAQKLIANGVANVTIVHGDWDLHFRLPELMPALAAKADRAIAAFLDDNARAADPISLTVTGEFNRTPRINRSNGRDHWRHGGNVLLSGPFIAGGAVHGRMDDRGENPLGGVVVASRQDLVNTIICGAGGSSLLREGDVRIREVLRAR